MNQDTNKTDTNIDRLRDFFRDRIGKGKMFSTAREMSAYLQLSHTRATILYKFLKGAEPRAGIVLDWLERLGVTVVYPDTEYEGIEFLPVINGRAGAGCYIPYPGDENYEKIRAFDRTYFSRFNLDPNQCFFLDVVGDSMEPLFSDGSTLLIDSSSEAKTYLKGGKIYVVNYDGGVHVKRIRLTTNELALVSENPLHKPIVIEHLDKFSVVGRVRWYSVNV